MIAELAKLTLRGIFAKCNELVRAVNKGMRIRGGGPIAVSGNPDSGYLISLNYGQVIERMPKVTGGSTATRLHVKSVQNDYLTCRTWDGTTEGGTDILVAKPPMLRHDASYYNISTATLTTINQNEVEIDYSTWKERWMVTPDYKTNTEIWAVAGATGVMVTIDEEEVELALMDDNRNARAWGADVYY